MKNGSPRNWMEDKWNKVASAGFVIIKQLDLTNYDREEWPTICCPQNTEKNF